MRLKLCQFCYTDKCSFQTGEIWLAGSLDREEKALYTLNVSAFDGFQSGFAIVYINVTDVNDNKPVWDSSSLIIHLNETQMPSDEVIGQLKATDKDKGNNGTIWYHIDDASELIGLSFTNTTNSNLNFILYPCPQNFRCLSENLFFKHIFKKKIILQFNL